MPKQSHSRLAAAIGGKWLAYIPAYASLVPLWFLASILSTPLFNGWAMLWPTLVANLFALALCAGVFMLLRVTLWRNRANRPVQLWIVILSGVLFGVVKATSTAYFLAVFTGQVVTDLASRIFSSSVLGVGAVIVVPVMFSQLELYRAEREQLIAELVRRNLSSGESLPKHNQENPASPRKYTKPTDSLEEFVARSRQRLKLARIRPSLLPQILEEIREKDARALSHQIWQRENERIPEFTLSHLITLSLSRLNFVITPVLIVFIFIAGPVDVVSYGVGLGVFAIILQCLVIAAVLWVARRLPQRGVQWGLRVFIAAIVTMTGFIAAITPLISDKLSPAQNIQQGLSILLLLGCAVFASSVVNMAQRNIKQVHEDINALSPDLKNQALHKAESTRLNLELAQLLHSQVQNVLLTRSMQLQEKLTTERLSSEAQNTILSQTVEELDGYLENLKSEQDLHASSFHRIEEICAEWAGVLNIHIDADLEHLANHPELNQVVSSILAEGIANAVKHGLAKNSLLTVKCYGAPTCSELSLVFDDDGIGVRKGRPGLGSMYLNSIPQAHWELAPSRELGGASLRVQLHLLAREQS